MRKITLFILTIALIVSGCRDEKPSLHNSYLKVIDIITEDDFSLDKAKKAWDIYDSELFATIGFSSVPLFEECLKTNADLNQKIKSYPQEVQATYKKIQTEFFEFLNCIRKFKISDDGRRDLIRIALDGAYEHMLTSFLRCNEEFLNTEMYKDLDKDDSKLSPLLCAHFYYQNMHKFNLNYNNYRVYIHNCTIFQTSDKNTKLLVLYNSNCQAELIFIAYDKKTHEFKQIKPQEDLYFCNHSSDDYFSLDSKSGIFTIVTDEFSAKYVLDLKKLKLKKK